MPRPPEEMSLRDGAGRSTVLAAALRRTGRERAILLRWAGVAAVVAVLSGLGWAVGTEALDPSGPGRALYQVHDLIWVPLWSWIWTAARPWSLIWLLAPALLALLSLVEFLGLAQPVRGLQGLLLRALLGSRLGDALVAGQVALGPRDGFLTRFIEADLTDLETAARRAVEEGGKPFPDRQAVAMARQATRLGRLTGDRPAVAIRLCEVGALLDLAAPSAPGDRAFDRYWMAEPWAEAATLIPASLAEAVRSLRAGTMEAPALAVATLGAARLGWQGRDPRALDWFARWAEVQLAPAVRTGALSKAETLIAFEFWAAQTEAALRRDAAQHDRKAWLGALLPEVGTDRPSGELAAAGLVPFAHGVEQ